MSHSNSIIPHNQQDEENKGQAAAIRRLTPDNQEDIEGHDPNVEVSEPTPTLGSYQQHHGDGYRGRDHKVVMPLCPLVILQNQNTRRNN